MRRLCLHLCLLAAILFYGSGMAAAAAMPEVTAEAAVVIDAATGRIVYEKKADERLYPASMTKIMTCILALEEKKLTDTASVSQQAAATEWSPLGMAAGDKLSYQNLLLGMMLESDNGAAVAVAENVAGSVPAFAEKMNKKAKEIGALRTHFVTPNGLHDDNHYSTARDMAKIAAYCWKNEEFRRMAGTKEKDITWLSPAGKNYKAENSNELLGVYPGMNGMKTGYTDKAGGCFVAEAERDGVRLITVVMHSADCDERFNDTRKLLDAAFAQVKKKKLCSREKAVRTVWVYGGRDYKITARPAEDVVVPLLNGEDGSKYTVRYETPLLVRAPVGVRQQLGNLVVYYDGKEVERVPMLADSQIGSGYNLFSMLIGIWAGVSSVLG